MKRRFVILREAGGIGDVVRTFPVARGLKEKHSGCRVDYVCLAGYEGLVRLSPDVDRVFTVAERERRPRDAAPDPARFAYLRRVLHGTATTSPQRSQSTQRTTTEGPGQRLSKAGPSEFPSSSVSSACSAVNDVAVGMIDLYCPAYRHEVETAGAVTLDRVEIFCREAGVEPSTPRIVVPEEAVNLARAKLRRFFGGASGPVVGLAPYATHVIRSLPSKEQVTALARELRAAFGADTRLLLFHSWKCARPAREEVGAAEIGAYPALKLPWAELVATVAACDLVISVDTGILHMAGALGVRTAGIFGPTSGEVICRPYRTHTWISCAPWGHDASSRPGGRPTGDAGRRSSARPSRPHVLVGCSSPCYGRPERGYSPDVCGRAGCRLMRGRVPLESWPPSRCIRERHPRTFPSRPHLDP